MMQWKKDLESLVEQTKTMVKHASQRGMATAARSEVPSALEPIQVASIQGAPIQVVPIQLAPVQSSPIQSSPPPKPPAPLKAAPPPKAVQPPPKVATPGWSTPQLAFDAPAREEILQRVAGFRAHQEKMRREREDYYLEMTEKMRAILRNDIQNKH